MIRTKSWPSVLLNSVGDFGLRLVLLFIFQTYFLEFNTSWSMLWWSWKLWRILTMGDTRHVWITKYSRYVMWRPSSTSSAWGQIWTQNSCVMNMNKIATDRSPTIYKLFWSFWFVGCLPRPCLALTVPPLKVSARSCISESTFCLIFNSSDVGPKTPPPSKESFWTLSYQNNNIWMKTTILLPPEDPWPGNYNNSKWIASGWPYKLSSQATKTVRITKGWRRIIVSLVLFLNQFDKPKPDLIYFIWFDLLISPFNFNLRLNHLKYNRQSNFKQLLRWRTYTALVFIFLKAHYCMQIIIALTKNFILMPSAKKSSDLF